MKKQLSEADKERLKNIKSKTQEDVITINSRFSIWKDHYQWFLYDFRDSRETREGTPKPLPTPTYHPKLEQLVDHMVEYQARDAKILSMILAEVLGLKDEIKNMLKGFTEPLGITPSDAAEKLRKGDSVDPE